ncbi:hypothetical protein Q3G72_013217 [Acer saccharum]|nr:hypothetical protein Q3G72_013217 [Acer saccharum]
MKRTFKKFSFRGVNLDALLDNLLMSLSSSSLHVLAEGCEKGQVKNFELVIMASQSCLAAISLLCFSFNFRKYGIKRFLFVDRYSGQLVRFRNQYIQQIKGSICLLLLWSLPCFILKVICEVLQILYVRNESWWLSTAILLALVLSWTLLSTISLSASILFHLVCNLQVIHFTLPSLQDKSQVQNLSCLGVLGCHS